MVQNYRIFDRNREMDFDRSGAISRHELREGMPEMGVDLTQNDCDWLMLHESPRWKKIDFKTAQI